MSISHSASKPQLLLLLRTILANVHILYFPVAAREPESATVLFNHFSMMNDRSSADAAAAGFDKGLDREVEAMIVQEVRKQTVDQKSGPRNGRPSPPAKLCQRHVFYSLDGDEVMAYNVEVHTDNTGMNMSTSTKDTASSQHVRATGSPRNGNSETGLPSRFIYSESLREDILEQFDLVAYQESKSDVSSTKNAKMLKSRQESGSDPVADSISREDQVRNSDQSKISISHPSFAAFLRGMNNHPEDTDPDASAYNLFCDPDAGIWCSPHSQSTLPKMKTSHATVAATVNGPEARHSQANSQDASYEEANAAPFDSATKTQHGGPFPEVLASIIAQRRQALTSLLSATHDRGTQLLDRFSQDVHAAKRLWRCEDDNDDDEYEILSDDEGALTCGTPTTGSTALDSSREPANPSNCMGFSPRNST